MLRLLDHALAAAKAGVPVFPLLPGAKMPDGALAQHGVIDATTDEATIRAWWEASPTANIGGAVGAAGLTVIDLDMKGVNGGLSLLDWELAQGESIPRDLVVRTVSGGHHVYLRGETRNRGQMLPGVDVRGIGGYAVLPGSVIDGKTYDFIEGDWRTPAPDAPAAWIAAVGAPTERAADAAKWMVEPDLPQNIERARNWLHQEVARGKVAREGQGGDLWTVKTAAMLRDFGISQDAALDMLDADWNPFCEPPWERSDLARKVANAYKYANLPAGVKAAASMQLDARLSAKARERARARFTPLTWPEIQNLPEPRWLLPGTLPATGVSMLYGPQASYKSFLALAMALDVATGLDTLGLAAEGDRPDPGQVLYIAGEGAFGIRKRIDAWVARNGVGDIDNFRLVTSMPALSSDQEFNEFVGAVSDADVRPVLVVVDTVARAMYGFDENSALDMGRLVKNADMVKAGWNCNVLLIHHASKAGEARGSGALPAAVDTEFRVSAKHRKVTLTMTKQKDAEQWENPRTFDMDDVESSVVPVPATVQKEEVTGKDAEERNMAVFDAMLENEERKRDYARDHELSLAVLDHLGKLSSTDGALPVSVAALARQLGASTGHNADFIKEWLRGRATKRAELASRVVARDSRNRPTFYGAEA